MVQEPLNVKQSYAIPWRPCLRWGGDKSGGCREGGGGVAICGGEATVAGVLRHARKLCEWAPPVPCLSPKERVQIESHWKIDPGLTSRQNLQPCRSNGCC